MIPVEKRKSGLFGCAESSYVHGSRKKRTSHTESILALVHHSNRVFAFRALLGLVVSLIFIHKRARILKNATWIRRKSRSRSTPSNRSVK